MSGNGAVIDLQISALEIKAMVSGSSIYRVTVSITALAPTLWQSICADCAGGIDSLVELLQGRFSKGVMERICRQDRGLFPKPSDIRFSCTCPDGASMCKHVAAVLYGVGARLDARPELLFRLRAVDEKDLVADLDTALSISSRPLDAGKVLETDDISALFGLDMAEGEGGSETAAAIPAAAAPAAQSGRRRPGGKNAGRKPDTVSPPPATIAAAAPKNPTSRSRKATDATSGPIKPRTAFKRVKVSEEVKTPEPAIELTPDGYVKWWK